MKLTVNGVGIACYLDGPEDAPVVTLSHALSAHSGMWAPQMPALAAYRVLRFDSRGHGASDIGAADSFETLADDVAALWRALGIERSHFVGLSMGGMIGQAVALKYPGMLRSLVLCDTTSRVPPEAGPVWDERIALARAEGMAALVDATMGRWFTAPYLAERADEAEPVRRMILGTDPRGFVDGCAVIRGLDNSARLGAIRAPTLVIVGEDDPGTPVAEAERLRDGIPGAELVVLEAAAHLSNWERPEAFNAALVGFLDRHEPN